MVNIVKYKLILLKSLTNLFISANIMNVTRSDKNFMGRNSRKVFPFDKLLIFLT